MGVLEPLLLPSAIAMLAIAAFNFADWLRLLLKLGLGCLRGILLTLRRQGHGEDEDPEKAEQVAKLVRARRSRCAESVNELCRIGSTLRVLVLAQEVFSHTLKGEPLAIGWLFIAALVSGVAYFSRGGFTERGQLVLHIAFLSAGALMAVTTDPADRPPNAQWLDGLLGVLAGGLCLRFRVLVPTSLLFSLCTLTAFARSRIPEVEKDMQFRILGEAGTIVTRLLIFYSAEALIEHSAEREIAAKMGKCKFAAVSSLLDQMCDAVVNLDSHLRFKSDSLKLANMLINSTSRTQQGCAMVDLIGDAEDRASFVRAVGDKRHDGDAAGMTTTRLRDSIGNLVKVNVYYVQYQSIGGITEHLVGLQEEVDERAGAPGIMLSGPALPEAVLNADIARKLGVELLRAQSASDRAPGGSNGGRRGSKVSSRSRGNGSKMSDNILGDGEVLAADLSVGIEVRKGLPVAWMGAGLRAILGVGHGENCDLAEFLNAGWLKAWIDETVEEAIVEKYGSEFTERVGECMLSSQREGSHAPQTLTAWVRFRWPPRSCNGEVRPVVLAFSKRLNPAADGASPAPQTATTGGGPQSHPLSL